MADSNEFRAGLLLERGDFNCIREEQHAHFAGSPERSSRIPTSARLVLASIASSSRDRCREEFRTPSGVRNSSRQRNGCFRAQGEISVSLRREPLRVIRRLRRRVPDVSSRGPTAETFVLEHWCCQTPVAGITFRRRSLHGSDGFGAR
jgi:hypothetical protein